MNAQEFCYWLQGFSELTGERPSEAQWAMIQDHLKLVFTKVTGHDGVDDILDQMRRQFPDAPLLPTGPICATNTPNNAPMLMALRDSVYAYDDRATKRLDIKAVN